MNRRGFLKRGAIGGALLIGGGLLASFVGRDPQQDRDAVLRAVAAAVLNGAIPAEGAARQLALDRALAASNQAINGLAPASQAELAQLFGLLAAPPTRVALAGLTKSWSQASVADVGAFLERWRHHRLALMQSGYHALHDLIAGPWYGDPATWSALGYPGPIALERVG